MGRGKRDISRSRRIIRKILDGMLYKQIAYEEHTTTAVVSALKSKYIDETVVFKLNAQGIRLMDEEQLHLPLQTKPRLADQRQYQEQRKADRHRPRRRIRGRLVHIN